MSDISMNIKFSGENYKIDFPELDKHQVECLQNKISQLQGKISITSDKGSSLKEKVVHIEVSGHDKFDELAEFIQNGFTDHPV